MDIKIQKGVPIPPVRRKYPFREMQVGDSFFVAGGKPSVAGAISSATKTGRGRFRTAKEKGGLRVWRVE